MFIDTASKPKIEVGFRIGRLTVSESTSQRKNGYRIWKCSCDCGGTIALDTRTLQRGTVKDCGCETHVKPGQRDLTGQRFGRLVCLKPSSQRDAQGGTQWLCRCDCGKECLASTHQLTSGYRKSCGCLGHPPLKALAGQRFGMLTVLEYAGKWGGVHRWRCKCDCGQESVVGQTLLQSGKTKGYGCNGYVAPGNLTGQIFGNLTAVKKIVDENGLVFWRCRCACGKDTLVRQTNLVSGHTKSCGCLQRDVILDNLRLMDGTSITMLKATLDKRLSSNTSGYTGVYWNGKSQKWRAQITFQGKTYYLGSFRDIADAVKIRQEAEEAIFQTALPFYTAWQKRAAQDPQWAAEHPVSVKVLRDAGNRLYLEMLPDLA